MTAILGFNTVGAPFVGITDQTIGKLDGTAASYSVDSDGQIYTNGGVAERWLQPWGSPVSYEVRATLASGSTPTGTLNTWQTCDTDRTWSITGASSTLTIEIRHATSLEVLDTATISMTSTG